MGINDQYKYIKKNQYYPVTNYRVLCDGGGTTKHPCYYSVKVIEKPHLRLERLPINENNCPHGIVWKQTNQSAELASVYYALMYVRSILGTPKIILFHDSKFVIKLLRGEYNTKHIHLETWQTLINRIWWHGIYHEWIPGDIMKWKSYLGH